MSRKDTKSPYTYLIITADEDDIPRVSHSKEVESKLQSLSVRGFNEYLVKSYLTQYADLIEKVCKYHFKYASIGHTSYSELFRLPLPELLDFIEKTLDEIDKEPDHAPRWLGKYVKAHKNRTKTHSKLWY